MREAVDRIITYGWKVGDSSLDVEEASKLSYAAGALPEGAYLEVVAKSRLLNGARLRNMQLIPETTETYGGVEFGYQDGSTEKVMVGEQCALSAWSLLEDMLPISTEAEQFKALL